MNELRDISMSGVWTIKRDINFDIDQVCRECIWVSVPKIDPYGLIIALMVKAVICRIKGSNVHNYKLVVSLICIMLKCRCW